MMEVHSQVHALEEEVKRLRALVAKNNEQNLSDTKKWKPNAKQDYFYVTDEGSIRKDVMGLEKKHHYRVRLGNVFKTQEIAEMSAKSGLAKLRLHDAIDRANNDYREATMASNSALGKLNLFIAYNRHTKVFHCVVGYDTASTYDGYIEKPVYTKEIGNWLISKYHKALFLYMGEKPEGDELYNNDSEFLSRPR